MKKLSSTIFVLCTIVFASHGSTQLIVKSTSKNVFNIQYQSTQKGKVLVSILNDQNKTVYTEVINNLNSFVRPYNFSNMPEGEYTIAIKDENGLHTEKISHTFGKLVNYTHVAALPNNENKYWVNIYSTGEEMVKVRILTGDVVLFEQSVFVTGNHQSIYDLSKVKSASAFTFEVIDGNNQIHKATF